MLLPKSSFEIMPDSRERRVTYIKTHSEEYLDAWGTIECMGGFHVTLKLYRTRARTFIVINPYNEEIILDDGKWEIGIARPSLWIYVDGNWVRQSDESIPKISPRRILTKYYRDPGADRSGSQKRYFDISYDLSAAANDIVVRGRETFQWGNYEYGRLKWRDGRFSFE